MRAQLHIGVSLLLHQDRATAAEIGSQAPSAGSSTAEPSSP
jgi:hypothetical protein